MKTTYLIIALILSTSIWSQTIDVKYGHNIFSIKKDGDEITYQKKNFVHTTKKEKCSTNLFNKYVKDTITPIVKGKYTSQKSGSEFLVEFKINGNEGVLPDTDPFAQQLLRIPASYDHFRLSTEFRCQKK
ncbi:MAG: hypothetical protein WDA09_07420 [Bacteriovoracaceae bacterium]